MITNVLPPFFMVHSVHTGWPKNGTVLWYALTSSNINRFSKLFHCQNQEKMCNYTITKDPTTPQVCRYTTLWNVKCLQSNNWNKTTSVTSVLGHPVHTYLLTYLPSSIICAMLSAGKLTAGLADSSGSISPSLWLICSYQFGSGIN